MCLLLVQQKETSNVRAMHLLAIAASHTCCCSNHSKTVFNGTQIGTLYVHYRNAKNVFKSLTDQIDWLYTLYFFLF